MKFSTKFDLWFGLAVWIPLILGIAFISASIVISDSIFPLILLIFFILCMILILWIWFSTYYVINDDNLVISYGPFKEVIKFEDIENIKELGNPISSAHLSSDKIEIKYIGDKVITLSPKAMDKFIGEIKKKVEKEALEPEGEIPALESLAESPEMPGRILLYLIYNLNNLEQVATTEAIRLNYETIEARDINLEDELSKLEESGYLSKEEEFYFLTEKGFGEAVKVNAEMAGVDFRQSIDNDNMVKEHQHVEK